MFQLQLADTDVSNGSVAISWCLDAELIKDLSDNGLTDPQIVIVIAPEDNYHSRKEVRKIVPMKDLMTYVELKVSGKNKIFGMVSYKLPLTCNIFYTTKIGGEWQTSVLVDISTGLTYANWLKEDMSGVSEPIDIEVPAGIFAKEPAAWEKSWVNHFFRDKVVDQCEFRKRRLFAYSLQPLMALLSWFGTVLMLIAGLLVGARKWSAKYLLHPLIYSPFDVGEEIFGDGIIFFLRPDLEADVSISYLLFRHIWALPFMPIVVIPVLIACWFGKIKMVGVAIALLLLVAVVFWLMDMLSNKRLNKLFSWPFKLFKKLFVRKALPAQPFWYLDKQEMELITCGEKPTLTYRTIPSKRKSIRLHFQHIKSKVCRPFSQ